MSVTTATTATPTRVSCTVEVCCVEQLCDFVTSRCVYLVVARVSGKGKKAKGKQGVKKYVESGAAEDADGEEEDEDEAEEDGDYQDAKAKAKAKGAPVPAAATVPTCPKTSLCALFVDASLACLLALHLCALGHSLLVGVWAEWQGRRG